MVRAVWLWVCCGCLFASAARADRIDDLTRLVGTAPSHRVRATAAQVLGRSADPRAVEALVGALVDPSDAVRGAAATGLGQLGDSRAVGPLDRLRSDGSAYVRESASGALTAIDRAVTNKRLAVIAPPTASPRYFATVNVNMPKGTTDAGLILKETLLRDLGRLPRLATVADAGTAKLSAWEIEATITNLSTTGERLDCDVELVIATLPVRSIRAKVHAGASFNGVRPGRDLRPQRECLKGASQLLVEDVDKFFKAQGN